MTNMATTVQDRKWGKIITDWVIFLNHLPPSSVTITAIVMAASVLKVMNSTFRNKVLDTIRTQSPELKKNLKFLSPTNSLPVIPFKALKS
ncbi:hypothetical protein D3C75_887380 [compost metagenome]